MSSYEDLAATIELIVDAAIEADMDWSGYPGNVRDGFTHEGPYVHVTPPAGERRSVGGIATDGLGNFVEFTPPWNIGADVYMAWRRQIRGAFEDWKDLPDPGAFDDPIHHANRASYFLADGSSANEETGIQGGNPDLGDIETMNSELAQFNGATVNAFSRNYANRLPVVVRGQSSVAAMLWIGARGEQEIWRRARADITDLADKALEAMKAAHPTPGGFPLAGVLTVAGAVAGVAGLFVSGGTAAPVIAATRVGIGILSSVVPDDGEPEEPEVPLAGDTPQDVLEKLLAALEKLNQEIRDQESLLADMLYDAHAQVEENDSSFNLAAPTGLLDETDQGSLVTADDETRAKLDTLLWMARVVMPSVARQLDHAKTHANATLGTGPWDRTAGIGYGSTGPYYSFSKLEGHLENLLVDTAWEVRSAADHLEIAANDFQLTDEQARDALAAHTRTLADGSPAYDHDPPAPRPIGGHLVPF